MKIEKTFIYEEKDLIKYGFNSYFRSRGLFLIIITAIFALCITALIYITGGLTEIELFMLILFAAVLLLLPAAIYFQMKRSFKTSKFLQGEQYFVLEDDGVTGRSEVGESKVPWNMFHKFTMFKDTMALYVSSRQAYIFPARVFTGNELEEIKQFLTTNEYTKGKTKIYK